MNATATDQLSPKPINWRLGLLLVVAVVVVYLPVWRAGFIWDDNEGVITNPAIRTVSGLYDIWCTAKLYDYFPLTYTSFWLEWRLWGTNATGYHVTNVLLHALGTVLLWRVLLRLKIPGAWLAALVFGVHPVCVASVAWISERKNTLSLVFYLLSILWYLRAAESKPTRGGRGNYWLSLFTFLLALLSKTSVVTLPFVLVLCEWWQRSRESGERKFEPRLILRIVPFFALSIVLGLVTVWFQLYQPRGSDVNFHSDSLLVRLIGGSWAVWFYLWKALLPVRLSMIYPRWEIDTADIVSYLPGFFWLVFLYGCWRSRAGWGRACLFGLGTFWVTLWPVLGGFDMRYLLYSRVADHWQYLALISVIALAVGAAGWKFQIQNSKFRFGAALVVLTFSILSWRQAVLYAKPEMLWRQAVAHSPNSSGAWSNLGTILSAEGRRAEAEVCYREALRLKPDYAALNNFGYDLLRQKRLDEAISYLLSALSIKPDFPEARFNLGVVYSLQGKSSEAIEQLEEALRLRPDLGGAHNHLGVVLAAKGEFGQAISRFESALKLGFDPAEVHANLARTYLGHGDEREAVKHYEEALRLRPDVPDALNNLAWIFATSSDVSVRDAAKAVQRAERACELTKYQETLFIGTLAVAYAEAGRFDKAATTAEKARDLALSLNQTNLFEKNQKLVEWFKLGKPWREFVR